MLFRSFSTTHCSPALVNSSNLNYLPTGTYHCIITDSTGCTYTATVSVISEVNNLGVTGITHREGCYSCDGFIHLSIVGGRPPYLFKWDTLNSNIGSNSNIQQNLDSICLKNQTFFCTVSDSLGCWTYFNKSFPLNVCLPDVWNSSTISACTGQNNGTISLYPDLSSYLSCHLYNGTFTPIPTGAILNNGSNGHVYLYNLPAGDYKYIYSTTSTCDSLTVTVPELVVQVVSTNPTCGFCNGTAVALINGDTVNNGSNGWVVWSNDTANLHPLVDATICMNQPVQYSIYYSLCAQINGTVNLDTCNIAQNIQSYSSIESQQIQIIPNPNSGSFIIQLPEWLKEYSTIEIFNVLGEKVYSTEMPNGLNRKEITIKQSAGIYTCKLTTDDRFSQRKFVVY